MRGPACSIIWFIGKFFLGNVLNSADETDWFTLLAHDGFALNMNRAYVAVGPYNPVLDGISPARLGEELALRFINCLAIVRMDKARRTPTVNGNWSGCRQKMRWVSSDHYTFPVLISRSQLHTWPMRCASIKFLWLAMRAFSAAC